MRFDEPIYVLVAATIEANYGILNETIANEVARKIK
jgi:hypothetical protein